MGPELSAVVEHIMSDLGMGEDQSKIDALERSLSEKLNSFFAEDSHLSCLTKEGAEQSFTSHNAKIKEYLTRGVGGGPLWKAHDLLPRCPQRA